MGDAMAGCTVGDWQQQERGEDAQERGRVREERSRVWDGGQGSHW